MFVEGTQNHEHLILDQCQGMCELRPPGQQAAQSLLLTRG